MKTTRKDTYWFRMERITWQDIREICYKTKVLGIHVQMKCLFLIKIDALVSIPYKCFADFMIEMHLKLKKEEILYFLIVLVTLNNYTPYSCLNKCK